MPRKKEEPRDTATELRAKLATLARRTALELLNETRDEGALARLDAEAAELRDRIRSQEGPRFGDVHQPVRLAGAEPRASSAPPEP